MDENLLRDSGKECKDSYLRDEKDIPPISTIPIKDITTPPTNYTRLDISSIEDRIAEEQTTGKSELGEIETPFQNDEPGHAGRFTETYESGYTDFIGTLRIIKGDYISIEATDIIKDMYETDYEENGLIEKNYFSLQEETDEEPRYSTIKEEETTQEIKTPEIQEEEEPKEKEKEENNQEKKQEIKEKEESSTEEKDKTNQPLQV